MADEEEDQLPPPEEGDNPDDETRRLLAAQPIGKSSPPPESQPAAQTIAPVGSTEDLENKAAARTIPRTAAPETGSTEDLEAKADTNNPLMKAAAPHPVTSGVASLWTKADNIHNPILRVLGKVGAAGVRAADTIGSIAAPGAAMMIPGSTLNTRMNENRERRQNTEDIANDEKVAQTKNLDAQPELKQAGLDIKQKTLDETAQKNQNTNLINLRRQGLTQGEDGRISPIQYAEMSPHEQGVFDLQNAEKEMKEAQTALAQSKNDPTSPVYQQAQARLQTAQRNAQTAAGRLGLEGLKYKGDYLGEDAEGKALPGTEKDAAGAPIGPRVQKGNAANAPTAQRLNKSDLARNAQQNIASMKALIDENPDLFGKVSGRFTTFQQMMGSDDPAIAKLGVEGHNLAMSSNGIHGLRSAEAVQATEHMLMNNFRNSPKATKAALDAMGDSVKTFIDDAQLGKKAGESAVPTGTGKTLSQAAIQQAAKDHNVSVEEAAKQAKAAGYTIQ